ncbi:MAG: hypothetical protein ACXABC_07505 [Candidatus Thorarchaeota archaeon]|jgi:hypothetical protein
MAYIPEERTLRLAEIQFTVLPESEWLIGISDLGYFQGIGFSLPIPFDIEYFGGDGNQEITPLHAMASSSESTNLYAFLPGLFYCSKENTTVDAILVEVVERNIFGMALASFRPESVRSFDIRSGLAVDDNGEIHSVEMSMETIGKFTTGLSEKIAESLKPTLDTTGTLSLNDVAYTREEEIATRLAEMLPLDDLKRAYVSGAIMTGQVMTLLHDIESHGLRPRHRIYVKNQKYPEGKVVEVRYRAIDGIIEFGIRSGVDCPKEADLGLELMKLSFACLVGNGKEVDIEEAIIDTLEFFLTKLGARPSKDRVMELIFTEGYD